MYLIQLYLIIGPRISGYYACLPFIMYNSYNSRAWNAGTGLAPFTWRKKKMYTGHKRPNQGAHIIGPCDTVEPIETAQYSPTNTDTNIWGRSSSQTPNILPMTEKKHRGA